MTRSGLPAALAFLAGTLPLLAAGPPGGVRPPVVPQEVIDRLAAMGSARVVILLDIPAVDRRDLDRLRSEVDRAQERVLGALAAPDFTLRRRLETIPLIAGEIRPGGLAALQRAPGVLRVDLEREGRADLAQSVPLIRADQVHLLGFTGAGSTVGVIDTGIDTDHPDLTGDLDGEACFCVNNGGCCPGGTTTRFGAGAAEDDHWHGTHVAGIVTSEGTVAPRGVAPDAKIVAVKVLDQNGETCCMSDVLAGLDWILDNRPDVDAVNISIGSNALYTGDCDNSDTTNAGFALVIGSLRARGVHTFVSSGNDALGSAMSSPACVSGAISVGAVYDANIGSYASTTCTDPTTTADQVTCFSNSSSTTDLAAPGAIILSTIPGGSLGGGGGTSMAAPHAAGCAADLLQAYPGLGADPQEATFEATGRPVVDAKSGRTLPRIDCLAAIAARSCPDADGDGFWAPGGPACPGGAYADCDDADPTRFPGNPEVCDFRDNDCDGVVDDGLDPDGDGYVDCVDNCPAVANDTQTDRDADGLGDACDLDDGFIDVVLEGTGLIRWQPEAGYTSFNLYRGDLAALHDADGDGAAENYGDCLAEYLTEPSFADPAGSPAPGAGFLYLVSGRAGLVEDSLGPAGSGAPRPKGRDCAEVFGVPPVIESASIAVTTEQIACDFTTITETRICALGVPGAQASAPIIVGGTYTQVRIEARVIDPDSTPGQVDIADATATLLSSGGTPIALAMLDDGSALAFPETQRADVGEDCLVEPGGCVCELRTYMVASGDPAGADALYTRIVALVNPYLTYLQDCILDQRGHAPRPGPPGGGGFEVSVTAIDHNAHSVAWPPIPGVATPPTWSCSGDACGCCLLVSTDPVTECRGLSGMIAPGYPAGICLSF